MDRGKKQESVAALREAFESSEVVVLVHQSGLTVEETTDLRVKMLNAGAGFRVTKNRLARIALEGTPYKGMANLFTGPTAIAYSKDPVAPTRVIAEFMKSNEKVTLVGGALGERILSVADVEMLSQTPSLDVLRGKIVGLLQAPATRVATILQAPGSQVARVISAYSQK